jgi:hypothetical protein
MNGSYLAKSNSDEGLLLSGNEMLVPLLEPFQSSSLVPFLILLRFLFKIRF